LLAYLDIAFYSLPLLLVSAQCRLIYFKAPLMGFQPSFNLGYLLGKRRDLVFETGYLAIQRLHPDGKRKFIHHRCGL
jgi:hypothetical protein